MTDRKKVAILTNVIAPYRIPIYREIGKRFSTVIFHSGTEENRTAWGDVASAVEGVEIRKSAGFVLRTKRYVDGRFFDYRYTHITPGYFPDLIAFRPDAVVSNEMGFRSMAALAYGAAFRKPVWVWWGNTPQSERNLGRMKKFVRSILSRRVPRWISYGRSATEYLSGLGVRRDRILEIQNCVDEEPYLAEAPPAISLSPRPVLLYVGQLIARKGLAELLAAASRLAAEGRQFTLLFVGGGPEQESLETYASGLGLPNIVFHPPVPPRTLPSIYRSADCLVFPTLEDVWGLVVNEAIWSGLPVVASIHAGCTAEIVPPRNRFDPSDPGQFLDILRRAVDGDIDPADRAILKPCRDVAGMILQDIQETLEKRPSTPLP